MITDNCTACKHAPASHSARTGICRRCHCPGYSGPYQPRYHQHPGGTYHTHALPHHTARLEREAIYGSPL